MSEFAVRLLLSSLLTCRDVHGNMPFQALVKNKQTTKNSVWSSDINFSKIMLINVAFLLSLMMLVIQKSEKVVIQQLFNTYQHFYSSWERWAQWPAFQEWRGCRRTESNSEQLCDSWLDWKVHSHFTLCHVWKTVCLSPPLETKCHSLCDLFLLP